MSPPAYCIGRVPQKRPGGCPGLGLENALGSIICRKTAHYAQDCVARLLCPFIAQVRTIDGTPRQKHLRLLGVSARSRIVRRHLLHGACRAGDQQRTACTRCCTDRPQQPTAGRGHGRRRLRLRFGPLDRRSVAGARPAEGARDHAAPPFISRRTPRGGVSAGAQLATATSRTLGRLRVGFRVFGGSIAGTASARRHGEPGSVSLLAIIQAITRNTS